MDGDKWRGTSSGDNIFSGRDDGLEVNDIRIRRSGFPGDLENGGYDELRGTGKENQGLGRTGEEG